MVDISKRMSPLGDMILTTGLVERPFTTQINLRGDPDDTAFVSAVKSVVQADLPLTPNTVSKAEGLTILWLGPDEWLIIADDTRETTLMDQLAAALADQHVAVNNISANRTVLELAGPHALQALMKSCDMDLHPRVFGEGQVVQTMLSKSQAIIENKGNDCYHIYVRCSFSRYLAGWLSDALLEYQD